MRVLGFATDQPRILLSFTHWARKPPRAPVNPGLAQAAGMGFVGVVARQNHWWQTPEFPAALSRLRELLGDERDITAIGSSMGGAGAVLAAQFLGVTRVLAVAPPVIVDRQVVPWERRFGTVADLTRMLHPIRPALRPDTQHCILYDPFHKLDSAHVRMLAEARPGIIRWPLAFAGHSPLKRLQTSGRYRDFLWSFVAGADIGAAAAIVRSCRNDLGQIEAVRALEVTRRRHGKTSPEYLATITALADKFPQNTKLFREKILSLIAARQHSEAMGDIDDLAARFNGGRPSQINRLRACAEQAARRHTRTTGR